MGNCQISHHGIEKLLMKPRPLEYWRASAMRGIYLRRLKRKSRHAGDQGFRRYIAPALSAVSGVWKKRERGERHGSLNTARSQWPLPCSIKTFYSFASEMELQPIRFCVWVIQMCAYVFIYMDVRACTHTE